MPGIFSPIEVDGRWLVDGGLVNPVPVSLCRALGADFIIAVNVNEDLLGRRLTRPPAEAAAEPTAEEPTPEQAGLLDLIKSLPRTLRAQAQQIRLFGGAGTAPGYFDVLANSINIMQDRITRSRLAGEPPHALVVPHLADVALMDFHRAAEAIAEGRAAAERALPAIEARMRAAL